ncbi:YMGG-like glycine zipper-containing protein [Oecophyllibacter saccharovorans]|uniref:Cell envelope biogenesis protein OmpA n=1 Tax=Oecophyllibacter saccharovorans TaxID=2558360 RepID=A0A506URT2_9PROT|nr:YMGG-like glycine zipper-containing protein [Oecophyllibacter saccharovorans]QDH14848.1 hypothetical protein E3E11_02085 [Oecophyllibacter saccharovorans]TPW35047.1 hypothetical protein E3203_06070 [Oecophyllibacter saccharovorans]TPW35989.1 hypothetical protein E3202_03510 [Oecophyllibacter saccharovorans]
MTPKTRRSFRVVTAGATLALLGLGACTQQEIDNPTDRALGGALLTGAAGAAIGDIAGGGTGAAIGALSGLAAGGAVGWLTAPGTSNISN